MSVVRINGIARAAKKLEKIEELKGEVAGLLQIAFPVNCVVHWNHGTNCRWGIVFRHSVHRPTEVGVRLQTGATRWIGITELHEFQRVNAQRLVKS